MRRMTHLLFCAAVVGAAFGCRSTAPEKAADQAAGGTPPAAREAVAGTTGAGATFLQAQLSLAEKETGLAQLVAERATRPEVKRLGEALIRDHQQAAASLRQLAAKHNLTMAPGAEQLQVERDRLSKLTSTQFEREYLDEIIADHERAIAELETAATGQDAEIRQWAADTLPRLRRHLEEARELRKSGA